MLSRPRKKGLQYYRQHKTPTFIFLGFVFIPIYRLQERLGLTSLFIGGGNTAIDSARTALRLGAKEVTIVYRRSRDEMPASLEESVSTEFSLNFDNIIAATGQRPEMPTQFRINVVR